MNFSKEQEDVLAYIGTHSHVWAPHFSVLKEQRVICPEYLKISKVYYYYNFMHINFMEVRCGACSQLLLK